MNNLWDSLVALGMAKIGTISASAAMAIAAVLIDAKRHTLMSAILAIIVGTLAGVIAASSITALMGWPEQVGYGISAVFAISGQNLVKAILRSSKDPIETWERFRGKK